MRTFNKYKSIITLFVLGTFLTASCIEEGTDEIAGKGQKRFRVPIGEFNLVAFDAVVQTRPVLEIYRDVTAQSDLKQAATVDFELSQTLLDDYNLEHGTAFVLLPDANYDFVGVTGTTISFPADEFSTSVDISLNPAGLDFSKQYALPFLFKNPSSGYSVSKTSEGVVIQVTVKNAFDGKYTVKISQSAAWAAFGIWSGTEEAYPGTISLSTSGATQVELNNDYTGTKLLPGFADGPAATQFGAITPVFTFDASGNLLTIANPSVDSRNRQLVLNPAAAASDNKFSLANKSITMNLLFKQNGRPDLNMVFKYTYAGPR